MTATMVTSQLQT